MERKLKTYSHNYKKNILKSKEYNVCLFEYDICILPWGLLQKTKICIKHNIKN